jgi:hypothetical protein
MGQIEVRARFALICTLERFPITWNHVIDKESLKFKELEHVLVEKVEQLFRDMLQLIERFFPDQGPHDREAGERRFPLPWNWKTSRDLYFIAFSWREPVSTSLENALAAPAYLCALPPAGTFWAGRIERIRLR